jgi:hypothetical protein
MCTVSDTKMQVKAFGLLSVSTNIDQELGNR